MCVIFFLYKHPSSSERVALRPETLDRRKLRLVLLAVFTSVKLRTFSKLKLSGSAAVSNELYLHRRVVILCIMDNLNTFK